jgi:cation transport protein ChaC
MQQEQEVAGKPNTSGLWIFGYGSLCWHPGFEFDKSLIGYVRGFSRKFWQGNTTHRGTEYKVSIRVFVFHIIYFCLYS